MAGQYTAANSPEVAAALTHSCGAVGRALAAPVADLLPSALALALSLLLGGALLIALVLGLPAEFQPPVVPDLTHRRRLLRVRTVALLAIAILLSCVTVLCLVQVAPATGTLILWVLTPVPAFVAALSLDRTRGTQFTNPFHRREWLPLAALVILELAWVGKDLTDWHWAGIPDESFFFATAKAIVEGRLTGFPLSEDGVFGYHPLASSYYQALFMKLLGANIFAWRLSSVAALAASLPALYLLTRELWTARTGLLAAVLFGSAQLVIGYAHFGYNNVQVYPVMLGSLAILSWAVRQRSVAGHFGAGWLAGLGFYTYYPARLTPLLAVLLLWSVGARRRAAAERVAVAAGIVIAILPVLTQPREIVTHMLQQTAIPAGAAAVAGDWSVLWQPDLLRRILEHWVLSLLYPLWFNCASNFEWVPVVDPVVAVAAAVGWWLSVFALARRAPVRFLVPTYLLAALLVGAFSQYSCPPLTRLLTLAPFTAVLAAIALDRVWARAAPIIGPGGARALGLAVVSAAVLWNITALQRSMYQRHHGYGDGTTGELIRITNPLPDDCRIVYVQNNENDMYDVDKILDEYGRGGQSTYIRPFGPLVAKTLATVQPPFVVVYNLRGTEEQTGVERGLLRRFPEARWADSAPGKPWNLRYASVPEGLITPR